MKAVLMFSRLTLSTAMKATRAWQPASIRKRSSVSMAISASGSRTSTMVRMMAVKALQLLSIGALLVLIEHNAISKHAAQAFIIGERIGSCASCIGAKWRGHEVHMLGSYLDSLSSGGSEDDASDYPGGPGEPAPRKSISVNSYLDSLSKPRNEPTSYGDISYGQGGISPASWASYAAANGYLDNIGGAHGATPSPWDSGKSPSPWTPPDTPAKFAPVPLDNQAKKDQGLLFFADVLSSQKNQQGPPLPTTNLNVQNRAIGEVPGRPQQPPPGAIGDPSLYLGSIPKYNSLYEEIEEEVGVIRPPKKEDYAPQQQQQQQQHQQQQLHQQQQVAYVQEPPTPPVPYNPPVPAANQAEPIVSVEAPEDPNTYTSVPQPGEVVAPAPFPAPRSSSGPPSWVLQATQETNSMPIQPIIQEEEQIPGPRFASDEQTNYASRAMPPEFGYSTPSPVPRQQTPSRPQPQYQAPAPPPPPAPAPVKKEEPVRLASRPEQEVVNFKKGARAIDEQQKEIDDAFLRLAGALATSTSASSPKVGAVLVSLEGEILGEGGNEDAVLEAMQQSGFRFVPPRNGEGIGVTPPRMTDPRTMTLYTTSHPEDDRISKAIRNSCIGRVVVLGD